MHLCIYLIESRHLDGDRSWVVPYSSIFEFAMLEMGEKEKKEKNHTVDGGRNPGYTYARVYGRVTMEQFLMPKAI